MYTQHVWKQISPDDQKNLYCECCGTGSVKPSEFCSGANVGKVQHNVGRWFNGHEIPERVYQTKREIPAVEITQEAISDDLLSIDAVF